MAYLLGERSGDDSYPDDVDEATAAGDRVETEAPVESDA